MSNANTESVAGHVCHCGKRFVRREHLRRHQATHREPSFVCPVCQYSFTRSDLLRRHVARHVNEAVVEPRVRQACSACHASKTRCDGISPCSSCTKKGIECLYSQSSSVGTSTPADIPVRAPQESSSSSRPSIPSSQDQLGQQSYLSPPSTHIESVAPSIQGSDGDVLSPGTRSLRFILALLNTSSHTSLTELFDEPSGEIKIWSSTCIEAYLGYFHAHWPIVHGPTLDPSTDPLTIAVSVLMIGHWLAFPESDAELLIAVHQKLVDVLLRELGAGSKPDQPWRFERYQAVLLNIIFAFYIKHEQAITRAAMLLGLLTAVLRQIGFFSSEIAAYQEQTHFPGTFLPFVLSNRERRTRLVACLFKIDTCFSLASGQGPHLQVEELDVDVPSTFTVWNAHPLEELYKRYPQEPVARAGIRLANFYPHPELLSPTVWVLEDVQFGLCGLYREVWKYNMIPRNSINTDPRSKDQFAKQLDFWKAQLDRVSNSCDPQWPQAYNGNFSLKFYQGWEADGSPSTLARFKSIVHDSIMLFYAVGLSIYSDKHIVNRSGVTPAATVAQTTDSAQSLVDNTRLREWALSADGKKCLSIGIAALEARQKVFSQGNSQGRSIEPLADVALSNSAAVLSAWFEALKDHAGMLSQQDALAQSIQRVGAIMGAVSR